MTCRYMLPSSTCGTVSKPRFSFGSSQSFPNRPSRVLILPIFLIPSGSSRCLAMRSRRVHSLPWISSPCLHVILSQHNCASHDITSTHSCSSWKTRHARGCDGCAPYPLRRGYARVHDRASGRGPGWHHCRRRVHANARAHRASARDLAPLPAQVTLACARMLEAAEAQHRQNTCSRGAKGGKGRYRQRCTSRPDLCQYQRSRAQ